MQKYFVKEVLQPIFIYIYIFSNLSNQKQTGTVHTNIKKYI